MNEFVLGRKIGSLIHFIRGRRVMLDSDLARIYGVTTIRLNQQVQRNLARFPPDFMFQLTKTEAESLRLQNAILDAGRGRHRKYLPYVFTEHGAVMLAAVLRTPVAVEASIQIARAFVKLREVLAANKELSKRLAVIERRLADHAFKLGENSGQIALVLEAIKRLMEPPPQLPEAPRPPIGFTP